MDRRVSRTLSRLVAQIDIGFGDSIIPRPAEIEYPVLLEFPAPKLLAYPRETDVAEKLEAITVLGELNSRMKDYFDLMLLSQLYEFDGAVLHRAVRATFKRRSTEIQPLPIVLTDDFALVPGKAAQWKAFLRRSRFETDYANLDGVIRIVRGFAGPVLTAAVTEDGFESLWRPGGPWVTQEATQVWGRHPPPIEAGRRFRERLWIESPMPSWVFLVERLPARQGATSTPCTTGQETVVAGCTVFETVASRYARWKRVGDEVVRAGWNIPTCAS